MKTWRRPTPDNDEEGEDDPGTFKAKITAAVMGPGVPVVKDWSMSIARIVSTIDKVPRPAVKALGLLDRFGSVRLTPTSIGFDNTDVTWDSVVRVETAWLLDLLTNTAIDREVERLRAMLPPIPGRTWVINKVLGVLRKLVEGSIERSEDATPIVSVVTYRSRFNKEKTMSPGLAATIILATFPGVNESVLASAEARSKPITRPSRFALDNNAVRARYNAISNRLRSTARPQDVEDQVDSGGGAD